MNLAFEDTGELRAGVLETCRAMSELGFCVSTWGNISVRLANGNVLITPSRVEYDAMTAADLVEVSAAGVKLRGTRLPSSETLLHCALLAARPEIPVWIHTHAPACSAMACRHASLPVIVEDMAQIIGGEVRCARYVPGGRHRELAEAATEALAPGANAVFLANHGVIVGGRSLDEALAATRVLEKAAAIWGNSSGTCIPIPAEFVAEERDRFLFRSGTE